jgi:hypothetical protein
VGWSGIDGIVDKLNNEDVRDFCYCPKVIRMTKSRRMRLTGHVGRKERRGRHVVYTVIHTYTSS